MENINVFKKKTNIFKIIIISILLALFITFGVSLVTGFKYSLVISHSMNPTLPKGTMIVLEPTSYEDLKVGDIITYKMSEKLWNTHRVVRIAESGRVVTAGDAQVRADGTKIEDGEIPENKLVGKVVFYNYPVGSLISFIKENIMLSAFIMLAFYVIYLIIC